MGDGVLKRLSMTTKRFPVYRDILNLCMLYLLLLSLFMVTASSIHIRILPAEYLGIGIVIVCCYLMRELIRGLWLYILLHLLMIAVCFFFPLDNAGKTRLVITVMVMSLLDLHNWISGEKSVTDMHPGLGVLFAGALFFTGGKFEFGYSAMVYYMGVAFVILFFLRKLITGFYDLSLTGQMDDDMPVGEIFFNNSLITLFIIAGVCASMLFVRADRLILSLNRLAYFVWLRISGFLSRMLDGQSQQQTLPDFSAMEELMRELAQSEPDNGIFVMFMRLLESLIVLLCIVVIVYCSIAVIRFVVRALFEKRNRRNRRYKTYQHKNEVRQSLRAEAGEKKRSSIFRSPYEKVRDLYKKEMMRQKKAGAVIRNTRTPVENREGVRMANGTDLSAVTELYERVRYAEKQKTTAEDVSQIRNLIRISRKIPEKDR